MRARICSSRSTGCARCGRTRCGSATVSPTSGTGRCIGRGEAELHIDFMPSQLSHESVIALVEAGGFGGIGEWRPSAPKSLTGTYGRFTVIESPQGEATNA